MAPEPHMKATHEVFFDNQVYPQAKLVPHDSFTMLCREYDAFELGLEDVT